MKVISGLAKFPALKRSIVTIGNLDGVHIAHQQIINKVITEAKQTNAKSVVITFWPHPEKVLHQKDILLLSSLEHRIQLIRNLNPDYCLILHFTLPISKIPMSKFVEKVLVNKLGMKSIYVGEDFRFGRQAHGSISDLTAFGGIYNFKVNIVKAFKVRGRKVSSSFIRALIQEAKLNEAEKFLGRKVSLIGKIIHGDKRGKDLGCPTANVSPQHEVIPPDGIYAVKLLVEDKIHFGICYIGSAPTFDTKGNKRVEVHIFDFDKIIYHKLIEVRFIKFIRPDKKFANKNLLVKQMQKDILHAKKLFKLT